MFILQFDYKTNKLYCYSTRGLIDTVDTLNIDDIFIIDGVDYSDRFITENDELLHYFIEGLNDQELLHKLMSFKDPTIQSTVLKRRELNRNVE